MVQGKWVGDPLPVSLCAFFLLFSFQFFLPYERIYQPLLGRRFRPLCLDPFLLLIFLLGGRGSIVGGEGTRAMSFMFYVNVSGMLLLGVSST